MQLVASVFDWARSVRWFCHSRSDPTTRVGDRGLIRASWTPDGPGTIAIRMTDQGANVDVFGPGGTWLAERAPAMSGERSPPLEIPAVHPVVTAAARRFADVRMAWSGNLYHEILPTIIAQRITSGEAARQWVRLCSTLGEEAPGPFPGMRTPPAPEVLRRHPYWALHPLGIERTRVRTLQTAARHAGRLWEWSTLPCDEAAAKLALLGGVGPWTIGSVGGPALGDPDAVPVGDYHLPSIVSWALAGEPRADDRRMLELLEPFRATRGRVLRLLVLGGHRPPSFGPRQRILPMSRW